jgi:hypothetical protein
MKLTHEEFELVTKNVPDIAWQLTNLNGEPHYALVNETYKRLFLMNLWHFKFAKLFNTQSKITLENIYADFDGRYVYMDKNYNIVQLPAYFEAIETLSLESTNYIEQFKLNFPMIGVIAMFVIISIILIIVQIFLNRKTNVT